MPAQPPNAAQPPVAERRPHQTIVHGDTLHDDYFWLRGKTDPGVLQYLEAENAYTAAVMKPAEATSSSPSAATR